MLLTTLDYFFLPVRYRELIDIVHHVLYHRVGKNRYKYNHIDHNKMGVCVDSISITRDLMMSGKYSQ